MGGGGGRGVRGGGGGGGGAYTNLIPVLPATLLHHNLWSPQPGFFVSQDKFNGLLE